jgi:hypothetical protein
LVATLIRLTARLHELIEAGLRHVLREQRGSGRFVLRDARVGGHGMRAELRGASWDEVRDTVYEGRGS